jgi:hypothetical protein
MNTLNRRTFAALLGGAVLGAAPANASTPAMVTYRDTGCGCCHEWVETARAGGYTIQLHDMDHDGRLKRFGLTEATAGCHTTLVAGYIVEGHVPFDVVARLLRERPAVRGITLPGMPLGVPGMPGSRPPGLLVYTLAPSPVARRLRADLMTPARSISGSLDESPNPWADPH